MNKNLREVHSKIKKIKIQGATNVALAVCEALRGYSATAQFDSYSDFLKGLKEAGKFLLSARATEPMADNVVEFFLYQFKGRRMKPEKAQELLAGTAKDFIKQVGKNKTKIKNAGRRLIAPADNVFTHCHSGTVIHILEAAKAQGKSFEVFQTETRPLYQGHKTAKDLLEAKIKDTLVVDSAGPYLISSMSDFQVDKLLLGCDAITMDGGCVNKVGSHGLALAAHENKVPVYIVTQALKINEDVKNLKMLKIEKRAASEVWAHAPKRLRIFNPAFDKIPAQFITGYITEFGIMSPAQLIEHIKREYKWLF